MAEFTTEDRVAALEVGFNALLAALGETGTVPPDTLRKHFCMATNELERLGVAPGAVALLDAGRDHQADLLQPVR